MAETQQTRMPTAEDWKSLEQLVKRANAGDQDALVKLRQFLDANPGVWRHVGDLARVAEQAWLTLLANGNALTAEATRRGLDQLRTNLLGDNPTAIERLLADEIVATHLESRYLACMAADMKACSLSQSSLLLKKSESTQKRHLAAIKSLTQVRRLLPNPETDPGLRVFAPTGTDRGG